ncbi:HAMP domain-containing protein [Candidatus Poribacteria bacterium]|nr:HAMP domain-containing protein [Candidatus Poribacteria bacterium]
MKLHIQTKATLSITLLVLLMLTASGCFFFYTASKALDAEMGQRLIAIAKASAVQIKGEYLRVLQPGSENTRLYQNMQQKLQSMRDAAEAQAIYVFDRDGKSLVDSRPDVPIGSHYRALDADQIHIEGAKQGIATVSTAFHGKDDAFYKSAYAPIRDEKGDIVAILAVDASVLFLEILKSMRQNMIIIGTMSILIAMTLSALFARSIVIPIKKLSHAAHQIKSGNFGAQVEAHVKDEVGMLAETFNEMSIAIQARDKKLSRLNEELRQMSAGLAHEVRNPLNGMRIFLELLKRRFASDTTAAGMIEKVDGEIQSLNRIVTEFLDFAKPAPLQWEMVNLSEVINSVLTLRYTEFNDNAVHIQTSGLEALPPIHADAEQLKQVFTNIVKNAVQAMSQGGTLTISGRVIPIENRVCLEFTDRGVGISPEVVERIFDPFFTTKDTGTGLGLAVVKRLLENHSGTIECLSEEGKGTTFVMTLPVSRKGIGGEGGHEFDTNCR